jgi:hypothetical protein
VWLFSPRRYQGKSPKWQRTYGGPFLVVDILEPVNLVIQRTSRSPVQVVHIDKVKKCFSQTPVSWLPSEGGDLQQKDDTQREHSRETPGENDANEAKPTTSETADSDNYAGEHDDTEIDGDVGARQPPGHSDADDRPGRPRRTTRLPVRFRKVLRLGETRGRATTNATAQSEKAPATCNRCRGVGHQAANCRNRESNDQREARHQVQDGLSRPDARNGWMTWCKATHSTPGEGPDAANLVRSRPTRFGANAARRREKPRGWFNWNRSNNADRRPARRTTANSGVWDGDLHA